MWTECWSVQVLLSISFFLIPVRNKRTLSLSCTAPVDRQTDDTLIPGAVYNPVRYISQSFDSSISFTKLRTNNWLRGGSLKPRLITEQNWWAVVKGGGCSNHGYSNVYWLVTCWQMMMVMVSSSNNNTFLFNFNLACCHIAEIVFL